MSRKKVKSSAMTSSEIWAQMSTEFLKSKEWRLVRNKVLRICEFSCCKCGDVNDLQCDHIVPRIKDTTGDSWLDVSNLQILCSSCHDDKGLEESDFRNHDVKSNLYESKEEVYSLLESGGLRTKWNIGSGLKSASVKIRKKRSLPLKRDERKQKTNLYIGRLRAIITQLKTADEISEEQDDALNAVFQLYFKRLKNP